jgi:hypothetical protein
LVDPTRRHVAKNLGKWRVIGRSGIDRDWVDIKTRPGAATDEERKEGRNGRDANRCVNPATSIAPPRRTPRSQLIVTSKNDVV